MKLKLSEIKKVSPNKLKVNMTNSLFFKYESGKYFDDLQKDIEKRGILVPLVAKNDGTLLAGHNRLLIAKQLKLKTIPVQYVESKISEDEEIQYIIKDNLLRRHLTPEEREELYKKIIPNFDERVMIKSSRGLSVKASEISEKTGLNPKTVGYDISRIRNRKQKEINKKSSISVTNIKAVDQYKKAVSKMLNIAILEKEKTIKEFMKLTEMALNRLKKM